MNFGGLTFVTVLAIQSSLPIPLITFSIYFLRPETVYNIWKEKMTKVNCDSPKAKSYIISKLMAEFLT